MRIPPCRSLSLNNREILLYKGRPGLSLGERRGDLEAVYLVRASVWSMLFPERDRPNKPNKPDPRHPP